MPWPWAAGIRRSRFDDAKAMLDYGFANFVSKVLVRKGETMKKELKIEGAHQNIDVTREQLRLVLPRARKRDYQRAGAFGKSIGAD
ncbi:MAG: hypothetical protein ACLT0Y_04220 [Christensenellales bacterium]